MMSYLDCFVFDLYELIATAFDHILFCFFFSSRRRHTRCALVTGVQTCALPISLPSNASPKPRLAVTVKVFSSVSRLSEKLRRISRRWATAVKREIGRASCREGVCQYV